MSVTLTEGEVQAMQIAARRFSGAYTGTSGSLAGMLLRALAERQRLLDEIIQLKVEMAKREEIRRPLPPLWICPD